jgi:hypothetical protein
LKQELDLDELLLCSAKTGQGLKDLWTQLLGANLERIPSAFRL